MQLFKKKGNRIRASDKSLVFRFAAGSLFLIQFHLTPYRIVTLIISAFTCLAAALVHYRFENKVYANH